MIEGNLRMVVSIAKKYQGIFKTDLAQLIRFGNEGLFRAVKQYNGTPDNPNQYYVWLIRDSIIRNGIDEIFPECIEQTKRLKETGQNDDYFKMFFVCSLTKQILVQLVYSLNDNPEMGKIYQNIIKGTLIGVFRPDNIDRVSRENFIYSLPILMEIMKNAAPDLYNQLSKE